MYNTHIFKYFIFSVWFEHNTSLYQGCVYLEEGAKQASSPNSTYSPSMSQSMELIKITALCIGG